MSRLVGTIKSISEEVQIRENRKQYYGILKIFPFELQISYGKSQTFTVEYSRLHPSIEWIEEKLGKLIGLRFLADFQGPLEVICCQSKISTIYFLLNGLLVRNGFFKIYYPSDTLFQKRNAKIFRAKSQEGPLICKELQVGMQMKDQELLSILDEVKVLQQIKYHQIPFTIQIKELFAEEDSIIIVMPECQGGTLLDYLKESNYQLKPRVIQMIMNNLLVGLRFLHHFGIMHRDIKMENIMFMDKEDLNSIKIIDFGLSTFKEEDNSHSAIKCGTPGYMSPEMFESDTCLYDERCDIYSLGVIFHTLLTGKSIFQGKTKEQIKEKNKKMDIVVDQSILGTSAYPLLLNMLNTDYKRRLSAVECLRLDYFIIENKVQKETMSSRLLYLKPLVMKNPFS